MNDIYKKFNSLGFQYDSSGGRAPSFFLIYLLSVIGIALSVGFFFKVNKEEKERIYAEFRYRAKYLGDTLEKGFKAKFSYIETIRGIYKISENVKRSDFKEAVVGILKNHSEIQSVFWVPRVFSKDRIQFEQAANREGFDGFQFLEVNKKHKLVRAKKYHEHFPLYYLEPFKKNKDLFGYDIASNNFQIDTLNIARGNVRLSILRGAKPIVNDEDNIHVLTFVPIYKNNGKAKDEIDWYEDVRGFVVVVISIDSMVANIVGDIEKEYIEFYLFDDPYNFERKFFYYRSSMPYESGPIEASKTETSEIMLSSYKDMIIDVGDRRWGVQFVPTKQFYKNEDRCLGLYVLIGGLLVTFLVNLYLYSKKRSEAERKEFMHLFHEQMLVLDKQNNDLSTIDEKLQKASAIRKEAQRVRCDMLEEKDSVLHEVHNRVRNNMEIVASLLQMQSRQIKDTGTKKVFDECCDRIKIMVIAHEKLYNSNNLLRIDFSEYIKNIVTGLFDSYKDYTDNILLRIETGEMDLGGNLAIFAGLVVNELVTNSLKHAFPNNEKGEIIIKLQLKYEKVVEMELSDNGIGLQEGFDFSKPSTLGLQLVKLLIKYIKGDIELDRADGTKFKITFQDLGVEKDKEFLTV